MLQKLLPLQSRSRSGSPSRNRSPMRSFKSPTRSASPSYKSPKRATKNDKVSFNNTSIYWVDVNVVLTSYVVTLQSSSQEAMMRMLEEERDFFKRECETLKTQQRPSSLKTDSNVPHKRTNTNCACASKSVMLKRYLSNFFQMASDSELAELKRERNELQTLLDKFERHMSEVHYPPPPAPSSHLHSRSHDLFLFRSRRT